MKIRWLLYTLCVVFILNGCKKDAVTPPPVVKVTPPPPPPPKIITHISVANTLQSNMVIQRNKPLQIWGNATALSKIAVKTSWYADSIYTTADGTTGNWKITIPVPDANASPQTITAKTEGADPVELDNILIGDVWICSGQSNMVFEMNAIAPFQGVTNFTQEIAAANYPAIRALTVQQDLKASPVDTLTNPAKWVVCSPQTAGDISGVAYYFARKLNTDLNVPIGIIISAVNGTSCEAWANQGAFDANPDISSYSHVNNATQLYNGMINPFTHFSITGFIWYQGENNKNNNPVSDYTKLNSALINGWRTMFTQGQLPFYFVQMTPFAQDYSLTDPPGGDTTNYSYAKFREAQANVLAVAGTGMAVTMDVGEPANQHPADKKPVGERLALLALKNTYGKNVQCYGPRYASFTTSGNTAIINFASGTADGLNTINNLPLKQYFFIAGSNHIFVWAKAQISGNQVIITAPAGFTAPIAAIRYAFSSAPVTNLQNSAALPMEPFRTDNWNN